MQPVIEKVAQSRHASFHCFEDKDLPLDGPYHAHPEAEIVHIVAGEGQRLVGDRLEAFHSGELMLLGGGLPHMFHTWRDLRARTQVVQFRPDAFGSNFFDLPEFAAVKAMLHKATRGLLFSPAMCRQAAGGLLRLFGSSSASRRFTAFIELLDALASDAEPRALASVGYMHPETGREVERLRRVLSYIESRWNQPITLAEAAKVACLHPQSLSRFFQTHLKRSFQAYLVELRLSRAARELLSSQDGVSRIAYDCGFNNLSNFNRLFRKHYRQSPTQYRLQPRLLAPA